MRTPLTIIVPAKHEEHTIIPTLKSLEKYVRTPHRIIVVNVSDKKDKTADIVNKYKTSHPRVYLIRKIHPHGTFGMPLLTGFKAVKSGVVVPFMADECDDPKVIDRMYQKLEQGWGVVCASRYMPGGRKIGGPTIQSFFSRVVCSTLQVLTGIPTSDVSNSLKMYKKRVLTGVSINADSGVEASMDVILQAYFRGTRITEIPTVWRGRTAGHSKFKFGERLPRYLRVYLWAVRQTLSRSFGV